MDEEQKATTHENIPEIGELPLEYIGAAQYLDLESFDLTSPEVRSKMDFIYDVFKKYSEAEKKLALSRGEKDIRQKNFVEFVMELNSKIGYKANVHPLDKIYSWLKLYGIQ